MLCGFLVIFLQPAFSHVFKGFFRVQVFQGPGFSWSRFFRVEDIQDPGFSGSRYFRVQVFPGPGLSGCRFFRVQSFQGGPGFRSSQQIIHNFQKAVLLNQFCIANLFACVTHAQLRKCKNSICVGPSDLFKRVKPPFFTVFLNKF